MYEHLWHLLIPPVMTLLDDFEVRFKLQGVLAVQQMLQHMPKDLMERTGINGLLHSVGCVYPLCSNLESQSALVTPKFAISSSKSQNTTTITKRNIYISIADSLVHYRWRHWMQVIPRTFRQVILSSG